MKENRTSWTEKIPDINIKNPMNTFKKLVLQP